MEDLEYKLLCKMASKISEAQTFSPMRLLLSIIFLIEFFLTFFGYLEYNIYYWLVLIIFLVGTFHLKSKFEETMEEYEELKKEYALRYEENHKIYEDKKK